MRGPDTLRIRLLDASAIYKSPLVVNHTPYGLQSCALLAALLSPENALVDVPTLQPVSVPSTQPSVIPTVLPSCIPSSKPTSIPSVQPIAFPSVQPSAIPSSKPSHRPSSQPTGSPSTQPITFPSIVPTGQPSNRPTIQPSRQPSSAPTAQPIAFPSLIPTTQPSRRPSSRPSTQPTSFPSEQPISFPSSQPTTQPTIVPSAQPFANPTSAPVATIYQTNGVLFLLGSTTTSSFDNQNKTDDDGGSHTGVLGSSFILFGRNFKSQKRFPFTISLSSSSGQEYASEIQSNRGGIRNDITTRSTTIIGDVNGDGFDDLLIGYPIACKCSVYLGDASNDFASIISANGESFAIVGDPYQEGGFLGWSSIRIGDVNGDEFDEIVVSAIYSNTIYIIFGRNHFNRTIAIHELSPKDGFKIVGGSLDVNFGVSMTFLHHFHTTGHRDIAATAQTFTGGRNIIYVLFGAAIFTKQPGGNINDVNLETIMSNPSYCFKIIAPVFSFAGFSLAGVGDINKDGFDDLALGSVPYRKGRYGDQMTYIIYGRDTGSISALLLSEMTVQDGFIVTGGGFLVTGVGDVNSDGVADLMITNYVDWQGQRNAYLIMSPKNMTYSPSLQPSSMPSTLSPSFIPTVTPSLYSANFSFNGTNSSSIPTFLPTFITTNPPISKPSLSPTRELFILGTAPPSATKPTLKPTAVPTRFLRTRYPSLTPTAVPTINTTFFTIIDCSESSECQANNETNNVFYIKPANEILIISGNNAGKATNLYVLYPPSSGASKKSLITIQNFRTSTDIMDLSHLTGFTYTSLKDITYSFVKGSLFFSFCADTLQVILLSHSSFDLQESNFIFTSAAEKNNDNQNQSKNERKNAYIQIGIIGGVGIIVFHFFLYLSRKDKEKEKANQKHEEIVLDSLNNPIKGNENEENIEPSPPQHQAEAKRDETQVELHSPSPVSLSDESNSVKSAKPVDSPSFSSVVLMTSNNLLERNTKLSEKSHSSNSSFYSLLFSWGLLVFEKNKNNGDDNNSDDNNRNEDSGYSDNSSEEFQTFDQVINSNNHDSGNDSDNSSSSNSSEIEWSEHEEASSSDSETDVERRDENLSSR